MQVVAVLAIEGAVALEVAGACQVFAAAYDPVSGEPLYDVRVCGDQAGTTVRAHRVEIFRAQAPYSFDEALAADTVIVPASYPASAEVVALVREVHRRGIRLASICTGAFTLAAAGVLDGRMAATHWAHAERFAREYPQVEVATDVLYLDDGEVLTSAGVTAGLDLCLHLVRRDHGSAVAANVARRLVMAPHRDGGQAQFITAPTVAGEGSLEPVMRWMQEHLDEPLSLASIAAQAAMSTRTLSRQFRAQTGSTPLQWLIRLRINRAQELLETTDLTIDQIATTCGFGSPLLLRQHFTKTLATTPTAYRRTFAPFSLPG
ncbi:helix-turn-helix domain-containing protein [Kribbella sp. NBC_00382]|uniref:GlxA family transcriptional regulator n=1 Tax=Kribbella sp. NBC_00382 TaxID=2975967 RepID=UPI002E235288